MRSSSNVDITTSLLALKACVISRIYVHNSWIQSSTLIPASFFQRLFTKDFFCLSHVLKYLVKAVTVPSTAAWLAFHRGWFLYYLQISSGGSLCIRSYNQPSLVPMLTRSVPAPCISNGHDSWVLWSSLVQHLCVIVFVYISWTYYTVYCTGFTSVWKAVNFI